MVIQKKLSNGITFYGEEIEGLRSVTLGIWVKAGSLIETERQNGISHFIEHMLFKGTERRTYRQIAEEMDNIGGQMNAFTSKECTCYYAKVMDEKLPIATDILTDMFCNSVFAQEEMDKERGVVLEEIAMSNDNPEDVAHETLAIQYFEGNPLAKTILGPGENVRAFTKEDILDYMGQYYRGDNVVVVAVGNFDQEQLLADLESKLAGIQPGKRVARGDSLWTPKPGFAAVEKDAEQVHMTMGMPAYSFGDRRKYAMSVLANIFGGSMSSRLFQRIREELGMAYSIYSYPSVYTTDGMLCIYAGMSSENAVNVTENILEEMRRMRREMITSEELSNTKEQLRGNFILGQESTSAKMSAIGKNVLLGGGVKTEEEVLRELADVTLEDVEEAINLAFDEKNMTGVYVGNVKDEDKLRAYFVR